MSFSSSLKDELCKVSVKKPHCIRAELCGMLYSSAVISLGNGGVSVSVLSEHKMTIMRMLSLFRQAYNIDCELLEVVRQPKKTRAYMVRISNALHILVDLGLSISGEISYNKERFLALTQRPCCQGAYVRGSFLGSGFIANPQQHYQSEFILETESFACLLKDTLLNLQINAKLAKRKSAFAVYIKEAQSVSDLLAQIGAHGAVLELENIRILKSIQGNINRQTNWDNANIEKTINAAQRQLRSIRLIEKHEGLDVLPEPLRQTARLRLENPEATLEQLAALCPELSRSGINHHLRKINRIALEIQAKKGENHDL